METLLIVDHRDQRRKRLASILCGGYAINQIKKEEELEAGSKPFFAIVHENNWAARNGLKNFKGKLEKMNIPFVIFSAGGKDQVLYLERGDEYGLDVWREFLNSKSNSLDIFYKPKLPETFIAAYLLMTAQKKGNGVSLASLSVEEWIEACKQYKEIGGENDADWRKALDWNPGEIVRVKGEIAALLSKTVPPNSMMLPPWNIPCQASRLRGALKHTYLMNKICFKTLPEDLLESMLYTEHDRMQHQIIRDQIRDLLEIMGSPDHGFSPVQLVDQLKPMQNFSDSERRRIKEQIHIQFSKEFQLAKCYAQLENISTNFLVAMDAFLLEPYVNGRMEKVQDSARSLISELELLPKGIWLWEPPK